MRPRNAHRLIALAQTRARARLQRERSLNSAIERKCPGMRPTERYLRGPLPSNDPRFYTTLDVIRYRAVRAMGKYDPHVRYPAPAKRKK